MIHILTHNIMFISMWKCYIYHLMTGRVAPHFVTGHQRLSIVPIYNLSTQTPDPCTRSLVCYSPRGDQSNFIAVHHNHSGVHVMHHCGNIDTCTPSSK